MFIFSSFLTNYKTFLTVYRLSQHLKHDTFNEKYHGKDVFLDRIMGKMLYNIV
jgi:hypothetical protein